MIKQQKTYVLLFAVVVIWGAIVYQIYSRLNPDMPKLEEISIQNSFQKKQFKAIDFYQLAEEYRDPFLGGFPKKKRVITKKTVKPKSNIAVPNIVYNGSIEGGDSSKSYIVTINGKQEIVKIGGVVYEVKLLKANEKNIEIEYRKQKKVIQKQ